ncbi:hypothetical protein FB446DRAFT_840540 [Lentinula raphanica]|nr:hypothetical protein FB446DRAFT_840540 [Lentinula raphanica]
MRFFAFIFSSLAIVLLMASAANAIAENADLACGPPNNGHKKLGDPCKYYGRSYTSATAKVEWAGTCQTKEVANPQYNYLSCDGNRVVTQSKRMVRVRR